MHATKTIVEQDHEEGEAAVPLVILDLADHDSDLTPALDTLLDLDKITWFHQTSRMLPWLVTVPIRPSSQQDPLLKTVGRPPTVRVPAFRMSSVEWT